MECLQESKITTPLRESTKFDSSKNSSQSTMNTLQKKISSFQTPDKSTKFKNQSQKSLLNQSLVKSPQSGKYTALNTSVSKPKSNTKMNKIINLKSKTSVRSTHKRLPHKQYSRNESSVIYDPLERSIESELEYERRLLSDINLKLEKYS